MRTTVTEIGPVLMARLLQLNDTQEGVLNIVFKVADEQGLLLLDFKDLQAVLQWTRRECRHAHHQVRQRQQAERSAPSSARC